MNNRYLLGIGFVVMLGLLLFILSRPVGITGDVMHDQYHWYSQHEERMQAQERAFAVQDDIIYRYAWYSINGTRWQRITLNGPIIGDTDWLNGTANYNLPSNITSTGEHYLITYTCTALDEEMTSWNCHGNETEDERGSWQLRTINNTPPEPEDNCTDGKQNQDETGIDCGGTICEPCSIPFINALIINVTASNDDGNIPENTLDGVIADDSRWSACGDEWILYELSEIATVSIVDIASWQYPSHFIIDIQTSLDGNDWETVFNGTTDGVTQYAFERFSFAPVQAKYVRIVGHGNNGTYSCWTSLLEVQIENFTSTVGKPGPCVPNTNECGPDGCGGEHQDCVDGICVDGACQQPHGEVKLRHDFEGKPLGTYATQQSFKEDWKTTGWNTRGENFEIALDPDDTSNQVGQFTYPFYDSDDFRWGCWQDSTSQGEPCGDNEGRRNLFTYNPGGMAFLVNGAGPGSGGAEWYSSLGGRYDEATVTFRARFSDGFDVVSGGKFFGLQAQPESTALIMFEPGNRLKYYVYHLDQGGDYGEGPYIDDSNVFDGEWHSFSITMRMNGIGSYDGYVAVSIDGVERNTYTGLRFRESASVGVQTLWMSTFFGGSGEQRCYDYQVAAGEYGCSRYSDGTNYYFFAPRKTEHLWIDDIIVYTE